MRQTFLQLAIIIANLKAALPIQIRLVLFQNENCWNYLPRTNLESIRKFIRAAATPGDESPGYHYEARFAG